MPIDLSAFLPQPDTEGDAEQIANGFTAIQTYLNTLNPAGGDTTQAGQVTADFDAGDASVVFATPFVTVPIVTGSVGGAGTFEPKNITENGFDVHVGWIAPVGSLTAYWFARLDSADAPPQDTIPASGMGSPAGSVTPAFVGQLYLDLAAGAAFIATGLANTSWVAVGGDTDAAAAGVDADGVDAALRALATGSAVLAGSAGPGVTVTDLSSAVKMGFFGATPAAKPTGVAVSAAGIHAALVTLGLIAA